MLDPIVATNARLSLRRHLDGEVALRAFGQVVAGPPAAVEAVRLVVHDRRFTPLLGPAITLRTALAVTDGMHRVSDVALVEMRPHSLPRSEEGRRAARWASSFDSAFAYGLSGEAV